MEYFFHFFFQTMIMPWLIGESRIAAPSKNGAMVCRYTTRIRWLLAGFAAVFALMAVVGCIRFPQAERLGFVGMLLGFSIAMVVIPWAHTSFLKIVFDGKRLIVRRLFRFRVNISVDEISEVTTIGQKFAYRLRTTSGRTIRLSRLITGIDVLFERIGTGHCLANINDSQN
jgi:hypothetical protein